MQKLGYSPAEIESELAFLDAEQGPQSFEIWPDNIPAFNAFRAVNHQWHIAPLTNERVGLNYEALQVHLQFTFRDKWKKQRRLYQQIQLIESGAIALWSERRAKR